MPTGYQPLNTECINRRRGILPTVAANAPSERFLRLVADHGVVSVDECIWERSGQCDDRGLFLVDKD
jgi:hypothetical protein